MKKSKTKFILILGILLFLAGCNKQTTSSENNDKEQKETTITLGVMPSTDTIPFLIAHEQKFDKKNGVNLQVEVFKSARDRDAALQAGKLDGVITDLVGIAIYHQGDMDVQIIGAPYDEFDLLTGDDTVKSVKDLKDKEVIFSKNTGTEYAVVKMLEKEKMTLKDVKVTEVPQVPTRLELLQNKKAAAAIVPEPFVTMGKASGLRVLKTTKDLAINPFAIGMLAESLEEKETAVKGMFDAYNEGVAYIHRNDKTKFMPLFMEKVGFPKELESQIEIPAYENIEQVEEKDVSAAFEWAREVGLLKKKIQPKDVMNDVYFE